MAKARPKILALDIETRPAVAYIWSLWDDHVPIERLIEPGGIICVGAKWLGGATYFASDWNVGHKEMLAEIHGLMSEADAVLTYNGDRFDLPKLKGEFILHGLDPLPPITSIDVFKTVKSFRYDSAKLAFVGPHLGIGEKVKHAGFSLWKDVLAGDEKAQGQMERYCLQDVRLLLKAYSKMRPFIKNHPHMGDAGRFECGACGSWNMQSRGFRRTKAFKVQRLQCQACGSWQDGTRSKV